MKLTMHFYQVPSLRMTGTIPYLPPSLVFMVYYYLTAIEFSLGGSSSYTSTDKRNKNKYT